MKRQLISATVLALLCSVSACAKDEPTPADWKTECVGRYQIALPGDVEVAVQSMKALYGGRNASASGVGFANGDGAEDSSFYVNGTIEISPALTKNEYEKYRASEFSIKNEKVKLKWTLHRDGIGFNRDSTRGAYTTLFANQRIVNFDYRALGEEAEYLIEAKARRDDFIKTYQPRKTYELPQQQGICIPHGFVKDDGSKYSSVGVAMRLIDRPDVEIFFKHADASGEDDNTARQFRGSRGKVELFWSHYGPTLGNKLDGLLDQYHGIDLGGYKGQYAFATIARPSPGNDGYVRRDETEQERKSRVKKEMADGTVPLDYGFMAAFKGEPQYGDKSKPEEPDFTLYVIRTASRAVAAGKQPVSEEELKKMALQIAASIQKRKTN